MEELRDLGRTRSLAEGAVLDPMHPVVRFVLSGGLGVFAAVDHLCVGWLPPGAIQGLHHLSDAPGSMVVQAVTPTTVLEVKAAYVRAVLGETESLRLAAQLTAERLNLVEREAACMALHSVEARLATWLLRLIGTSGEDVLEITQDRLAQILGVQRTTVNSGIKAFQIAGLLRCRRGRITIWRLDDLARRACGCGRRPAGDDNEATDVHTPGSSTCPESVHGRLD